MASEPLDVAQAAERPQSAAVGGAVAAAKAARASALARGAAAPRCVAAGAAKGPKTPKTPQGGAWLDGLAQQCGVLLDAPMANPLVLSDEPAFAQRQRCRARRGGVSDLAAMVTCLCQVCFKAALARVPPPAAPPPERVPGVRRSSAGCAPRSVASRRSARGSVVPRDQVAPGSELAMDFKWLLAVVADMFRLPLGEEAAADGAVAAAGAAPAAPRCSVAPGMRMLASKAAGGSPGSFVHELGVRLPDTVLIHDGKPMRKYSVDLRGWIEVAPMKTSAEMLRVLREFCKTATRPRLPPTFGSRGAEVLSGSDAVQTFGAEGSRSWSKASGGLRRSRSATSCASTSLGRRANSGPALRTPTTNAGAPIDMGAALRPENRLVEVALLRYNGGCGTRLMTCQEALDQMEGASKLPREFWKHVHMLQLPVQSVQVGTPTRYVSYAFDAESPEKEPLAPVGAGDLGRSASAPSLQRGGAGPSMPKHQKTLAKRVAAFPRKLNEMLAKRRDGQVGARLQILAGQFDFVLDEADGALWLVHATGIRCRRIQDSKEEEEEPIALPLFFDEKEFAATLQEQEQRFTSLRQRFGGGDPDPESEGGWGLKAPALLKQSDLLDSVEIPEEYIKYFDIGSKMNHLLHGEILPLLRNRCTTVSAGDTPGEGRSTSMAVWFKRWLHAAKKNKASRNVW